MDERIGTTLKVKRRRNPNFLPAEKNYLVDLVEKYCGTVESKKITSESICEKRKCWALIANEFNATNLYVHRDWHVLKKIWENLKTHAKARMVHRRQNMLATDVRSPSELQQEPLYDRVANLMYKCEYVEFKFEPTNDVELIETEEIEVQSVESENREIESLDFRNEAFKEEHKLNMKILRHKEQQEAEKAHQEKIKTEILLLQLRRAQLDISNDDEINIGCDKF